MATLDRDAGGDAAGLTQLVFDKALAHLQAPTRFPLPRGAGLERVLAERLAKLPAHLRQALSDAAMQRSASSSARTASYGRMGALDPASKEPLLERAASLVGGPRRGVQARARAIELERPRPTTTLVAKHTELRVGKVFCKDKLSTALRDDIRMALTVHDLYHGEDHHVAPFEVGKFRQGDVVTLDRPIATIPALDGAAIDLVYPVTVYMAEKDIGGGFAAFIRDVGALANHEMLELLAVTDALSRLALEGFAVAAETGFTTQGIAAAIALGKLGSLGLDHGIGRAVLRTLGLALRDGLRERLRDDVFSPTLGLLSVPARLDGPLTRKDTVELAVLDGGSKKLPKPLASYAVDLVYEIDTRRPEPAKPSRPARETSDPRAAHANLQKIDHVIVVMLENRSFDHMLGYLSLEQGRSDVDGLRAGMSNPLRGQDFAIAPLTDTRFAPDPAHNVERVTRQLWGDALAKAAIAANEGKPEHEFRQPDAPISMSGFVEDFERIIVHTHPAQEQLAAVAGIMGYHQADQVPAYHLLASEFALCNRWFCAFPGNTWVNRTIALTGKPGRRSDGTPITDNAMPMDEQAFVRTLDQKGVDWAFYSQDVPSLLMVDASHASRRDRLRSVHRFFADAKADALPAVSWIDPNFIDLGELGEDLRRLRQELGDLSQTSFVALDGANDDHPPGDIAHGQFFVLELFRALFDSPAWSKSLLLIVYDEHGGFHDHVPPPKTAAPESPVFEYLGARVPAIVVSPWVGRGLAANTQFDHTSIIRTILERFCRDGSRPVLDPAGIPDLGPRVAAANHLGHLLTEPAPRTKLGPVDAEGRRRAELELRAGKAELHLRVALDAQQAKTRTATPTDLQEQIAAARPQLLTKMKGSKG